MFCTRFKIFYLKYSFKLIIANFYKLFSHDAVTYENLRRIILERFPLESKEQSTIDAWYVPNTNNTSVRGALYRSWEYYTALTKGVGLVAKKATESKNNGNKTVIIIIYCSTLSIKN